MGQNRPGDRRSGRGCGWWGRYGQIAQGHLFQGTAGRISCGGPECDCGSLESMGTRKGVRRGPGSKCDALHPVRIAVIAMQQEEQESQAEERTYVQSCWHD